MREMRCEVTHRRLFMTFQFHHVCPSVCLADPFESKLKYEIVIIRLQHVSSIFEFHLLGNRCEWMSHIWHMATNHRIHSMRIRYTKLQCIRVCSKMSFKYNSELPTKNAKQRSLKYTSRQVKGKPNTYFMLCAHTYISIFFHSQLTHTQINHTNSIKKETSLITAPTKRNRANILVRGTIVGCNWI